MLAIASSKIALAACSSWKLCHHKLVAWWQQIVSFSNSFLAVISRKIGRQKLLFVPFFSWCIYLERKNKFKFSFALFQQYPRDCRDCHKMFKGNFKVMCRFRVMRRFKVVCRCFEANHIRILVTSETNDDVTSKSYLWSKKMWHNLAITGNICCHL